jgi:DNA/RNA-binding domain of Phe-tRNA-synthetase-like protein
MFQYDTKLLSQFPNTVGGIILAKNMSNIPSSDELQAVYIAEQKAVIEKIGDTSLSQLDSLSAWRSTFTAFGVNPTKTRSAPEALLRRLTKKGDIPSINSLVDIGNLVSIRYAMPVAVFDIRGLAGMITVRFADGTERYTELGSDEIKHPEKDEVIFADDTGLVFARRWCWRQSFQSAARLDTINAIIAVEAQHEGGITDVENAVSDLLELLKQFAGGEYQSDILTKDHPELTES